MTGCSELHARKLASNVSPQPFLALCQELGWVVALKLELIHQHTLTLKIQSHGARDLLGQFMPLIGLLMATEKQVVLGHFHMRPLQ